jgi:hypothetical protein
MKGRNIDMNLIERVKSGNLQVSLVWRFYLDSAFHWRWQQLAFDGTVVAHSKSSYSQYEACLANAGEHGYVSFPALSTKANRTSPKAKRSHIGLSTSQQDFVSEIATTASEQNDDMPMDDALNGD